MKQIVIIEDNYEFNCMLSEKFECLLKKIDYCDYRVVSYHSYDEQLKNIIYDDTEKIFIIDLELGRKSINGYEICHEIRDEAEDWNSVIIISSRHKYQDNIIFSRLGVLTYVLKDLNFEDNIKKAMIKAINIVEKTRFLEIGKNTKIAINQICYILKEKNSKYCMIKTLNYDYRIRCSLKDLENRLHFKKIKNYLLINEKNVIFISNKLVIFKNKLELKI